MARRVAVSAKLVQTLVFYDGPQLAYFTTNNDLPMIAVAIGQPSPDVNKFLGCEITPKSFRLYQHGKNDLHYLFCDAQGRKFYEFNWSEMTDGNCVALHAASEDSMRDSANFPEKGFFEEDHTEEWLSLKEPPAKRQLGISGR